MAAVLAEDGRPPKAAASVLQAIRFAAGRLGVEFDSLLERDQRREGGEDGGLHVRVPAAVKSPVKEPAM